MNSNPPANQGNLSSPSQRERDGCLDAVKGILIVLVLVGHLIQYTGGVPSCGEGIRNMGIWTHPVFKFIYIFHIPAFFLLSGANLAAGRRHGFMRPLFRRSHRLLLPVLGMAFVFHAAIYVKMMLVLRGVPPIGNTLFNIVDGALNDWWFSWSLWWCIVFVMVGRCLVSRHEWVLMVIWGCLLLFPGFDQLKSVGFFFLVGYYFPSIWLKPVFGVRSLWGLIPLSLVGYCLFGPADYIYISSTLPDAAGLWALLVRGWAGVACTCTLVVVVAALSRRFRMTHLEWLGRSSYFIYVSQVLLLMYIGKIQNSLSGTALYNCLLVFPLGWLLTVLLAACGDFLLRFSLCGFVFFGGPLDWKGRSVRSLEAGDGRGVKNDEQNRA